MSQEGYNNGITFLKKGVNRMAETRASFVTINSFDEQRSIPGTDCAYLYSPLSSPQHQHSDFYEFSMVTYGSFINEYNGTDTVIRKNHLLYFRVGETHGIYVNEEKSNHFSFIIRKERFEELYHRFFPHTTKLLDVPFVEHHLNEVQGEYITSLFNSLYNCGESADLHQRLEFFLYNVMALCSMNSTIALPEKSTDKYVDKLLNSLNNFGYVGTTVSMIYQDFPVAQSTLINGFRKRTGYTIIQYHGMKKMEYAAQLLAEGGFSVTDVCTILNIASLSHFIRKFKNHHGITPKEYQALHCVDYTMEKKELARRMKKGKISHHDYDDE